MNHRPTAARHNMTLIDFDKEERESELKISSREWTELLFTPGFWIVLCAVASLALHPSPATP